MSDWDRRFLWTLTQFVITVIWRRCCWFSAYSLRSVRRKNVCCNQVLQKQHNPKYTSAWIMRFPESMRSSKLNYQYLQNIIRDETRKIHCPWLLADGGCVAVQGQRQDKDKPSAAPLMGAITHQPTLLCSHLLHSQWQCPMLMFQRLVEQKTHKYLTCTSTEV